MTTEPTSDSQTADDAVQESASPLPADPGCLCDDQTTDYPHLAFIYNAACAGVTIIETQGESEKLPTLLNRLRRIFQDIQDELDTDSIGAMDPQFPTCADCRNKYRNDPSMLAQCYANCKN